MKKVKAVVLEKSGDRYTVLDKNGAFRHVHRRKNAEVGEEIEIQLGFFGGFGGLRVWAGVAAMLFLVLTTLFAWNLYQAPTAVAMLSVDINPSIQFTIDNQGNLLEIDTKNEDAQGLLSNTKLQGEPIDKVLEQIVTEAFNQKFLNPEQPWILVGYSPLNVDGPEHANELLSEDQIVLWLKKDFKENEFTPQVAIFPLTSQDREFAQKENLTLGQYALWQTAEKAGVETQPEELRDTAARVKLLENPKVQAQVRGDKKNPESLSSPDKGSVLDRGKEENVGNKQLKGSENSKKNGNDKPVGKDKDQETWNDRDQRTWDDRDQGTWDDRDQEKWNDKSQGKWDDKENGREKKDKEVEVKNKK